MNFEKRLIRGIVDELISNAFNAGAKNVGVTIRQDQTGHAVRVTDDGSGMTEDVRRRALERLNQPRKIEYDHYYGELAGDSISRSLSLVGMMVDEATVESEPGKGTTVTIYRKFS